MEDVTYSVHDENLGKDLNTKTKVVGRIKEAFEKDPLTTIGVGAGCVWASGYLIRSVAQLINSIKWKRYKSTGSTSKNKEV